MIPYPSIRPSSKAPRAPCVAFDKLDGSNFRAKWTKKQGFCTYGNRTQLINKNTEYWSDMVRVFEETLKEKLEALIDKTDLFYNDRQIIFYGEYFGPNSFAGRHAEEDKKEIKIFDILVGHKKQTFLTPKEFLYVANRGEIPVPDVVYEGNLNDQFIQDVRNNRFNLNEGVICKGIQKRGDYRGNVWMCKIKTQDYFDRLKAVFGEESKLYWE